MCTAVAFGIGLGLKDGLGKASEFFAGYAEIWKCQCLPTLNRKSNIELIVVYNKDNTCVWFIIVVGKSN